MKGISPLIATVLIISLTILVGGMVSIWLTGFTKTSIETIGEETRTRLFCSNGGISLFNLCLNSTGEYLRGMIKNTGTILLGRISIQLIYVANSMEYPLCKNSTHVFSCPIANLTLEPGELTSFEIEEITDQTFSSVWVITNCSGVSSSLSSSEIQSC